jgi:hypothetical protein
MEIVSHKDLGSKCVSTLFIENTIHSTTIHQKFRHLALVIESLRTWCYSLTKHMANISRMHA